MILLLVSLLLPFASSDILSDHLTHNLNVSVNPCDDFYLHVCSQSIDASQFPFSKIVKFYKELLEKFENFSDAAIINDVIKLNETTKENRPYFNHSLFVDLVRARCGNNDTCYQEEFAYFHEMFAKNDNFNYFAKKASGEEILEELPLLVDGVFDSVDGHSVAGFGKRFFGPLTNRLFMMEELKNSGVFDRLVNNKEDLKSFKEVILEKFRNTSWLNEKDDIGLSLLAQFEDKIKDLKVYYDLDQYDRDIELLRKFKNKYVNMYYQFKYRSTGVEVIDILFSIYTIIKRRGQQIDAEEAMLARLVEGVFLKAGGALHYESLNTIAILAKNLYPILTDNATFNKNYNLFSVIGHEMFHAFVRKDWANRSAAFANGMECLTDHFNRTCDSFGEEPCNSGLQTFTEDGPDVEGFRTNYEFFTRNYKEAELKEVVFESEIMSVNREQAFFYLYGINFCMIKTKLDPADVHSPGNIRLNGVMTQMPEFSRAFSCLPDQAMFTTKDQTCHLFGPNSK